MGRSLNITRTREQAKARSTEALAKARQGADFRQLIEEYSDDAHKNEFHGEQLNFSRKDAIPSFSQAAFALKVGEISNLVDTPFGYMVIRRIK
jgi:parvulin-like peptidyl-prolyl isomerase